MYPEQLELEEDQVTDLVNWFDTALQNHIGERSGWIDDINSDQADYIAKPVEEIGTFPFYGASTIVIPLTAIAFEAVHSRTMQRFKASKSKISVEIKDPLHEELDSELTKYLEDELIIESTFFDSIEPAIMEVEKLGTGVATATYKKEVRRGIRKGKSFEVVVRQGTVFESIPVTSFLMPFECVDPQTAPWCGHVFWYTEKEVRDAEHSGLFKKGTYEKLENYFSNNISSELSKTLERQEERENRKPNWPTRLEFTMVYSSFDVADEGLEEIVFIYHRDSRQLISVWHNWFDDLRRPYRIGKYMPVEFRWAAIGIARQNKMFQMEVTTQHRQRLDNATLANTRMWKAKRGTTSIKEDEPIFTNKIWFVDDMNDIAPMQGAEIYPSSYNNENQAVIYSQQRTGVNELTLGMPNIGTPGTASDGAARLQESGRKHDYTFGNIHSFGNQLLHDGLLNLVQWGPRMDRLELSPKSAEIELFLSDINYESIRRKVSMSIELVGQNSNKMLDRQNMTQVSGMITQYYTQLAPLIAQSSPEMMPEVTKTIITGANIAMRKILETFDIPNIEKFLIAVPNPQPSNALGQANPNPATGTSGNVALPSINNTTVVTPDIQSLLSRGTGGL